MHILRNFCNWCGFWNIIYLPAMWLCAQLTNIITIRPNRTAYTKEDPNQIKYNYIKFAQAKTFSFIWNSLSRSQPRLHFACKVRNLVSPIMRDKLSGKDLLSLLSVVGRAHILFN